LALRLIVFDLDGTLLGADNRLSGYTISVLERASQIEGLTLMAASGRSRWAAELVLQGTNAIDYVISSNGAVLYRRSTGTKVSRRSLTPGRVAELHTRVDQLIDGACWAWETRSGIVPDDEFRRLGSQPGKELDELQASPYLELQGDPGLPVEQRLAGFGRIVRGLLTHPVLSCQEVVERLHRQVPARLSSSSAMFIEVTAPRIDKGAMLRWFCARQGIDAAEVVAFGDHLNDLPMLRWAGRGIAMKGANAEVCRRIPEQTEYRYDEDGAAYALEKLIADL
jgi:hydroxymethylpyrimidine pyrophosphatase-like HAD family hydrolase